MSLLLWEIDAQTVSFIHRGRLTPKARHTTLRARHETNRSAAGAWTGVLAAYVLEKILEIALLFLRVFLRARSRSPSVHTPGLDRFVHDEP